MAMLHIDSGGVAARRTGRGTDLGLEAGQTSDPQNLAAAALDRVVAVAVARVPVVVCKYFSLDANIFCWIQIYYLCTCVAGKVAIQVGRVEGFRNGGANPETEVRLEGIFSSFLVQAAFQSHHQPPARMQVTESKLKQIYSLHI